MNNVRTNSILMATAQRDQRVLAQPCDVTGIDGGKPTHTKRQLPWA